MSAQRSTDRAAPQAEASAAAVVAAAARSLAAVSDTPRLDAELLLAFTTGRARSSFLAFPERLIEPVELANFSALLARRAAGEPLAYLTGVREFFSLELEVAASVLVPRPETELLVEMVLARCATLNEPAVLDVGTGSGAIALALKHALPDARVTGADVSPTALTVARGNGARLALAVRFVESRWFDSLRGERFDLIVSNPPYVRSAAVSGALLFEPRLALDGGMDGLDAYRELLSGAAAHLLPGGALLLEHGFDQREALGELATALGWRLVAAHDDLAGRPRALELVPGTRA